MKLYIIDLKVYLINSNFLMKLKLGFLIMNPKLNHWMKIRHMGEQRGKGLCKWNSTQKITICKIPNWV